MKYLSKDYIPKGQLVGFPLEVIDKMLQCQVLSNNPLDVSIFEKTINANYVSGGFNWRKYPPNYEFWYEVICNKNFDLFFKHYPKMEEKFEPKRGDLVLVRNNIQQVWLERIFVSYIEGCVLPIQTVHPDYEHAFKNNKPFYVDSHMEMRDVYQVRELTIKEIADKFNIPISLLRIKD